MDTNTKTNSANLINVARALAPRSQQIANKLTDLDKIQEVLSQIENPAQREFFESQWLSQLSQLSTLLAPNNSKDSDLVISNPSLNVPTKTFFNPTGLNRWESNEPHLSLVTNSNLSDGNSVDRTKLIADAAVLKNTGLDKTYWNKSMTTQQMLSLYDKNPKLLTNQDPSSLIIPPTLLTQQQWNQSPSMSQTIGPILANQEDRSTMLSKMDSSYQSIGPEKPYIPQLMNSAPQSSGTSSTSSMRQQDYENFNKAVGDRQSSVVDIVSKEMPKEIVKGISSYAIGNEAPGTIIARGAANLLNKIVGDDLPTKVVGDDVEGLASKSQFQAAAAAVNESVIFDLMARLTMLEQTTKCEYSVRPGASWFEGTRTIRQQIVNKNQLYKFQQVYHNYDLPGKAFDQQKSRLWSDNTSAYIITPTGNDNMATFSVTTTGMTQRSVPMLGNVTWQQLRPLMNNTSIAEFASAMRIKVRGYDIDAYANLMGTVYSQIEAMAGYSFTDKLAKLLGYICATYQFPRKDESTSTGVGLVVDFQTTTSQWPNVNTRMFPLQVVPGIAPTWGVISATDFIELNTGRTTFDTNWSRVYNPQYWGSEISVVMAYKSELGNGNTMCARWLGECAFPAVQLTRTTNEYNLFADNTLQEQRTTVVTPRVLGGTIRGPTWGVLVVVIDEERTLPNTTSLAFSTLSLTNCAFPAVVNQSWVNLTTAVRNFFTMGGHIPYIMAEVSRWEQTYGNNSDRASALRWLAEQTVCYDGHAKITVADSALTNNVLAGIWNNARPIVGTGQNYLYANYPGPHPSAFPLATMVDAVYRLQARFSSPCRQLRGMIAYTTVNNDPGPANFDNVVSNYTMGSSHPAIDFLTCRGWLRPSEEYPATRLYDPWQIVLTVNEMADVMATLADTISEVHSCQYHEFNLPYSSFPSGQQNYVQHHMKSVVWPAMRMIFNTGPQFPAVILNTEAFDTNVKWYFNIATSGILPAMTDQLAITSYVSPSRIPYQVRAKYSDFFMVNSPVLSFGDFGTHQSWLPNPNNNDTRTLYYLVANVKGDKKRLREISKLTMATPGTNDKNVNGLIMVSAVTRNTRIPRFSVIQPGQWAAFVVSYSASSNDSALATNVAFPIGTILPSTDVFIGGDCVYYAMRGPRELFAKGSNTMSVYLYVNNSSVSSMIAAPITNMFDQSEFQITDPVNTTAAFL